MIWVIGDIHGMIDPLERILGAIKRHHETIEPVDKLIFIGDYIDYGPDSRQVLDRLMDLEFPAVFLMGNNDDLALCYHLGDPFFQYSFSHQWFKSGGRATLKSLRQFQDITLPSAGNPPGLAGKTIKVPMIEDKYIHFLLDLIPSHREIFDLGSRQVGFSFFHGLPRVDQPLEAQLIKSRPEFISYLKNNLNHFESLKSKKYNKEDNESIYYSSTDKEIFTPYESFIWNDEYSYQYPYWGEVIIHGHHPTIKDNSYYNYSKIHYENSRCDKPHLSQYGKYHPKSHLPFFFSRAMGAGHVWPADVPENDFISFFEVSDHHFDVGQNGAVEAINLDTGAAFNGGALSALGLSAQTLAKNEFLLYTTLTVGSDKAVRSEYEINPYRNTILDTPKVFQRTIHAGRLGADMSNPKVNAPFPY
ncbi:MAG: metallophosphoesterase [Deltaproteobacteria bacterium]|jgi:hypothetical protein|nr:metallophosphoesterase [Deltaproteobacteria bacterium]